MKAHEQMLKWADEHFVKFASRSTGLRTTDTVGADSLETLVVDSRKQTFDIVVKAFEREKLAAQFWVDQWERYKDAPARRNANFALGRISGAYRVVYETARQMGIEVPAEVQAAADSYQEKYDQLMQEV